MTGKNAIGLVKSCGLNIDPPDIYEQCENLIIAALEKQIPKKPFIFKCPNCQSDNVCVRQDGGFSETKFDYCPDCGQALDWGDSV